MRRMLPGVDDVDLAHPHRGESGVVRFGRDARAAGGVERDGHFGIERFFHMRVAGGDDPVAAVFILVDLRGEFPT